MYPEAGKDTAERYRRFYPNDGGTGCICYDAYGASCIATCASNIGKYEIIKSTGFGFVKAQCSAGNTVLGCGAAATQDSSSYDYQQAYFVTSADSNSCQCYNSAGNTCYAICGQFIDS